MDEGCDFRDLQSRLQSCVYKDHLPPVLAVVPAVDHTTQKNAVQAVKLLEFLAVFSEQFLCGWWSLRVGQRGVDRHSDGVDVGIL